MEASFLNPFVGFPLCLNVSLPALLADDPALSPSCPDFSLTASPPLFASIDARMRQNLSGERAISCLAHRLYPVWQIEECPTTNE
jgi:hypothetical protein